MNPKQNNVSKTPNQDPKLRRQDYQVNEQEEDYHDEYDEGEITGYIQQPQQVGYAVSFFLSPSKLTNVNELYLFNHKFYFQLSLILWNKEFISRGNSRW